MDPELGNRLGVSSFWDTGGRAFWQRRGAAVVRVTALYVYPVKGCAGIQVDRADVVARGFDGDRRWMIVDPQGTFVTQRTAPQLALVRTAMGGDDVLLSAPELPPLRLPARHEQGARRQVQVWSHAGEAVEHPEGSDWISRLLGGPHALVYMPDDHRRPVNPERARPGDVASGEAQLGWAEPLAGGSEPVRGFRRDIVSFADAYPFLLISEASLADLNARLAAPIVMSRFRPNIVVAGCAPFAEDGWDRLQIGGLGFRGVKRCDRCVVTTIDPETGTGGVEPLRTLATYRREEGKVWFGMNLIHDGEGSIAVGDALLPGTPPFVLSEDR